MIWCISDILKFRRQWMLLTASVENQSEYMDIVEHNPQKISYFPDVHNTGGLFMRIGTGSKSLNHFMEDQMYQYVDILSTLYG